MSCTFKACCCLVIGERSPAEANRQTHCCRMQCRSPVCADAWGLLCRGPETHQRKQPADQSCPQTSVDPVLLHSTGANPVNCGLRQAGGSRLLPGHLHPCLSRSVAGRLLRCSCTCMLTHIYCCLPSSRVSSGSQAAWGPTAATACADSRSRHTFWPQCLRPPITHLGFLSRYSRTRYSVSRSFMLTSPQQLSDMDTVRSSRSAAGQPMLSVGLH